MRVDPEFLYGLNNQTEIDEFVNSSALTYGEFAVMSSMKERMYGVINHGIPSPLDQFSKDPLGQFVANQCVKSNLWRILQTTQQATEAYLGYNLSTRYHYEEIPLPRTPKFTLRFPGVEAIEVKRTWYTIPSLNKVSISPYLVTNATVVSSGGYDWIQVPDSLFKNPRDVIARFNTTGGVYRILESHPQYPKRTVDAYWELPIDKTVQPYNPGDVVNLQHKNRVLVTISKPTVPTGAVLEPVYYGTNQIIPYISKIDNGSTFTYTFLIHELVSSNFIDEVVNLLDGEFYKLEPYITFAYWLQEAAYTELVVVDDCDVETVYVLDPEDVTAKYLGVRLSNQSLGVVHICKDDFEIQTCDDMFGLLNIPTLTIKSATVRIWYKTNPSLLENKYRSQIPLAKNAAYHKVGANLPISDCGCKTEAGFIAQMQTPFGSQYISPVTNVEIYKTEYGQLYGDIHYTKEMEKLKIFRKPMLLSMTRGV